MLFSPGQPQAPQGQENIFYFNLYSFPLSIYAMWCLSRWPGLCPQEMSDQYGWTESIHWLVSTLILEDRQAPRLWALLTHSLPFNLAVSQLTPTSQPLGSNAETQILPLLQPLLSQFLISKGAAEISPVIFHIFGRQTLNEILCIFYIIFSIKIHTSICRKINIFEYRYRLEPTGVIYDIWS